MTATSFSPYPPTDFYRYALGRPRTKMAFKVFQIGKYTFEQLLGRGGMAEVFRVTAQGAGGFQKQFAIKRIVPSVLDNDEAVHRFKREANLNSNMNHPNVVQVVDFIEEDGNLLLVMEYVHGPDLATVIHQFRERGERIPPSFAAYVTQQACQGLEHAYFCIPPKGKKPLGIVHRDISPHNVMVSYDGHVKLVDFGIASATNLNRTQVGIVRGKLQYMSPEQANGEALGHASDIFATGLVLLELLLGEPAYGTGSEVELIDRAKARDLPELHESNPRIPAGLLPILKRALERDPAARYASAGDMAHDLKRYLEDEAPDYGQSSLAGHLEVLFKEEKQRADESIGPNLAHLIAARQENEIVLDSQAAHPRIELQGVDNSYRGWMPLGATRFSRLRLKRVAIAIGLFLVLFAGRAYVRARNANLAAKDVARTVASCRLKVASVPPRARITLNEEARGITPATLDVACGSSVKLTLQKPGFKAYNGRVTIEGAEGRVKIPLEPKKK